MKKIKISKKQWKQIIATLVISLFLFLIPLLSFLLGNSKLIDGFIALAVSQFGIFLIWLILRTGLFSTTSYGNKRYFWSSINNKYKSNGGFDIERKSKWNIDYKDNPSQIIKESSLKPKIGIYLGLIIGLVEIIFSLIFAFV